MKERFRNIRMDEDGSFAGEEVREGGAPMAFSARFDLFLIREAWNRGCDMDDLANGFEGFAVRLDVENDEQEIVSGAKGTHGDWSGIRDSTPDAIRSMFERALNFFFAGEKPPR